MSGFTPGPWVSDYDEGVFCIGAKDDGALIATVEMHEPHHSTEANARLIAAAPEHHEFVRGITDELGRMEWASPEHAEELLRDLIEKWHPKGRAAIAKALNGAGAG